MTVPSIAPDTVGLRGLRFDNRFTRELPADPSDVVRPRQVIGAAYSRVSPTPTAGPALIAYSPEVAEKVGVDERALQSPAFTAVFSGNAVVSGMDPHAACYGGHQFGNWAGQLGDGRAITLGEVIGPHGTHHTLQLKGAGPTPYSRGADGRAVLRSSVREFLCSEAMHHLGVPTTRALSLCSTGDQVVRDMFYDGRPEPEPGAVVCRVAPSFIRFGNFQLFAARDDLDGLRALLDHTIRHHFTELLPAASEPTADTYVALLHEVVDRTAEMVVHWQRVGFVHGVMNTDNMSIHGLTIDYGPYGWLEGYDPNWTPNTTDAAGRRYRFGQQPTIAHWNLVQLANALHLVVGAVEPLQEALDSFVPAFETRWFAMMAAKLGLRTLDPAGDEAFLGSLFDALGATETDMTLFFRGLADVDGSHDDADALLAPVRAAYYRPEELVGDVHHRVVDWLRAYGARVRDEATADDARRTAMHAVNPRYVLRNYLAQLAIDDATAGDATTLVELLDTLRCPYTDQPGREHFAEKRPEWARNRPGCSMLSCSS